VIDAPFEEFSTSKQAELEEDDLFDKNVPKLTNETA
jgi:hypothetical protein